MIGRGILTEAEEHVSPARASPVEPDFGWLKSVSPTPYGPEWHVAISPTRKKLQYGCARFGVSLDVKPCTISARSVLAPLATSLQSQLPGYTMGRAQEKQEDTRFTCLYRFACRSSARWSYHTGQLRDVSRTGIYFHSQVPIDSGAGLRRTDLFRCLRKRPWHVGPRNRASAKTIRTSQLAGGNTGFMASLRPLTELTSFRPMVSTIAANPRLGGSSQGAPFCGSSAFRLPTISSPPVVHIQLQ